MNIPYTHWIWLPDYKEYIDSDPLLVYFRKEFILNASEKEHRIKISADTRYKLYVNGKLVEFGPAKGNPKVWYYDVADLAPHLKIGNNVLAVIVLRYPLSDAKGNYSCFRTATPGLFLEDMTDSALQLHADTSWKCTRLTKCSIHAEAESFSPLQYLEYNIADPSYHGWMNEGYNDEFWENAVAYNYFQIPKADPPGDMELRPIPPMLKIPHKFNGLINSKDISAENTWNKLLTGHGTVTLPAHQKSYVEINAGEEMCGFLSLRLLGGAASKISILCSEGYVQSSFSEKGSQGMPKKDNRLDYLNGHLDGYEDIYIASGEGTVQTPETYEPFWFRTFRFIRLKVETFDFPLTIVGFDYLATGYPLKETIHPVTSDDSISAIWDISLRTLRRCMHETYIDCPFYEQLQYTCDSRNEILYTYMVSGDDRLARQCMESFRLSQRSDGMLNCSYPTYHSNVIPSFSIYYILMVHDHMMYFGDMTLVRHHLAAIDQILEFFNSHLNDEGLVGKTGGYIYEKYWAFIDWAIPWDTTFGAPPAFQKGPVTIENMLYVYGLQKAADLCNFVGRFDTASEYLTRALAVSDAIQNTCKDETGVYMDGPGVYEYSQHAQVFAVLTGMVSPSKGRILLERTLNDKNQFAQCTVAMAFYLFRALEKCGLYDRANELWDIWRNMLSKSLTTCVENNLDERSDCHAWGALMLYELPATILGVRPAAPGFEKILVSPNPMHLQYASGTVSTKWGPINISWRLDKNCKIVLNIQADDMIKSRIIKHSEKN